MLLVTACGSVVRDQSTAEFVDDAVITSKVKARLAQDLGASGLEVSVDTLNGTVLLSGFVDAEARRQQAVAAARSVADVRDVKADALLLKPERPAR